MKNIRKSFGSAVREVRSRRAMSQEELAWQARLHRTYISEVERGRRNISLVNVQKIARALNVSVRELLASV